MANLRDIKRRIDSVTSTKQITRTMEMVSTAKIRRALEAAQAAAPYKEAITEMLSNVASARSGLQVPLLETHDEIRRAVLIVIASDRGLAGGFNMVQQRTAEAKMNELKATGAEVEIIACGRKPHDYFRYRGIEPVLSFVGISSEPTMEEATQIASYVTDGYSKGTIDLVMLYYNHARNRVDQDQVVEQLLPIGDAFRVPSKPRTKEAITELEESPVNPSESDFTFDPSPNAVLGYLLPAYIRTVIYHALLDSAAAEHGARRRAMKSATDNATEVITTLNRKYNRIRQGSITTELNEIVGGAAALEEM
ncbi:MAG: ATP synthase F1 subunit gamma [Atopobiaceae bacterium]|nr:ATP synthase F1 subunit gamma [Atopobiaceae bacterium]